MYLSFQMTERRLYLFRKWEARSVLLVKCKRSLKIVPRCIKEIVNSLIELRSSHKVFLSTLLLTIESAKLFFAFFLGYSFSLFSFHFACLFKFTDRRMERNSQTDGR